MGTYDREEEPQGPQGVPPQRGAGLGTRLIIALVIALIGWFMYASHTEVNPITGEKQHVSISPDQEIRLGLESAPEMAREMGGEVPTDDPRYIEVQKIGQQLVSGTEAQKSPWKFKFHLLSDPKTINAFALPGGQIFITSGLYDKLQTEAELAGVLGHEMGHVIERHTAQQMAKSQLGKLLVVAVGAAASDASGGRSGAYSATAIAAVVNQMFQLRYSRQDESQADMWGIKLTEEVGYKPEAMIQVMEILKASTGDRGGTPEIFQTHPNPDLRMKQIREYLAEHPPRPGLTDGGTIPHVQQQQEKDLFDIFK